ncbi:hypothetical protein [Alloscardovia criceti]|uniref:hypothetical protein n=1 Tax=Alloscardovia criceti TaxID=356828 RepID=UPI0003A221B0|nr:hypothetical protein [Alloscardovia criceti]
MKAKENRPDACAASGTAKSIYKYLSTDAPDIQEEKGWLCLPEDCADMVAFCEEQIIAYAALSYLQGIDPENPPSRDTLKFELLTLTNRCIDAYNLGKRDPNAGPGAKSKDAYPDQKQGAERYKRLSGLHFLQIAIVLRELHHAIGIPCNRADDDNFDIGVYQESGPNKGCYDTTEEVLTRLIRGYNMAITTKGVTETVATLRDICEKKRACTDKDLVAVNNGIYDYGNKILMDFDPELVFLAKSLQGVPRLHGVVRGSGRRPDGGHAAPVRGVRSGGSRRQVRGRVRPTRQGCEGDARAGGHGAQGCRVTEGVTAGQSRAAYGQMHLYDV